MEAIVAVDRNWGIGRGGDQLVYLSEDLKRFKKLTLGRAVIVGRRTLSTFPGGRPLPGTPGCWPRTYQWRGHRGRVCFPGGAAPVPPGVCDED